MHVQTVGYYHRDSEFQVTPDLLPRTLNSNRIYFEDPYHHRLPFINLNINVPDSGAGELKMESLLEYIKLKGWPNDTPPQFVTNRQLLRTIAAGDDQNLKIVVYRYSGVIFIFKVTENETWYQNFGAVFKNFWTTTTTSEGIQQDGTVRKGVFLAEIPSETDPNQPFSVLFSGEIDAIDDEGNHMEFKVFSGRLNSFFWKNRSPSTYWQAIFGDVKTMVIGSRTGKSPSRYYPEWSVYKVQKLSPQGLLQELRSYCRSDRSVELWSVSDGEARLTRFFDFVKNASESESQALLMIKEETWKILEDSEVTNEFQEAVKSRLESYH